MPCRRGGRRQTSAHGRGLRRHRCINPREPHHEKLLAATAVAMTIAAVTPAFVASAEAAMITKRVVVRHGPFGHACRTVTVTKRMGMRVIRSTRRICR